MSELTIRDIARIAGVSTTAVSFVLHDKPGVSPETRARVQEIIRRTGFTPSGKKQNLRRSGNIHVVLYWHDTDLLNQFALEIMYGIFHSCKELGYSVTVTFADPSMDHVSLMESVRGKDCDGVILSQVSDPAFLARLRQERIPFVCVDAHVKKDGALPLVEVDYYQAAYEAVRYLCQCGHRQIGYLGPSTPLELHDANFSGYTAALREAGLACDPAWVTCFDFAPKEAGARFEQLLHMGTLPTAFFCAGDAFAIELMETAQKNGLQVPEALSIISVDNILVSRFTNPPLTTMTFEKKALGRRAMEVLHAMIWGKPYEAVTLLPTRLCKRGTVRQLEKGETRS